LHEPEAIRTGQGEPYKVYTPFSRACFMAGEPKPPRPAPSIIPYTDHVRGDSLAAWRLYAAKPDWAAAFPARWTPGEDGARARLLGFVDERLARYAAERDIPAADATSGLSPHLHFGEVSAAQVWYAARAA
jgi:deoxyribodipyrimidine photo-lyase